MKAEELAMCPDWPEVMDVEVASKFMGGKTAPFLALVGLGLLDPFQNQPKNVTFLKADIVTALKVVKTNGTELTIPRTVKTVGAALKWKQQQEKK